MWKPEQVTPGLTPGWGLTCWGASEISGDSLLTPDFDGTSPREGKGLSKIHIVRRLLADPQSLHHQIPSGARVGSPQLTSQAPTLHAPGFCTWPGTRPAPSLTEHGGQGCSLR